MQANVDEQSIINANSQFWEQMLAMTLDSMPNAEEFCVGSGHLLGFVALGGAWKQRPPSVPGGSVRAYQRCQVR